MNWRMKTEMMMICLFTPTTMVSVGSGIMCFIFQKGFPSPNCPDILQKLVFKECFYDRSSYRLCKSLVRYHDRFVENRARL